MSSTTVQLDPPEAARPPRGDAAVDQWLEVEQPAALERLADPRRDQELAERASGFVAGILLVALLLTAGVTGLNWYVDPLGEVRSDVTRRQDVRDKLDLIQGWRTAPDLLVLGSSVVMKWDPDDVERITGRSAFNAGVTGAQPKVMFAFASYVAEQHPEDFPNLVLGISHFGFHSGQDGFLREDDRLRRQLWRPSWRDDLKRYAGLASLRLAGSSLEVLRHRAAGTTPKEGAAVDGDPRSYRKIAKDGFLLHEYPDDPETVRRITANHAARYRGAFESWAAAGGKLNPQQVRYFERTIALANRHGHTPVVVLTQLNPAARELLRDTPLEQQEREVLEYMREAGTRLDFTLVDARRPERFGGSEADFYDATHISSDAAARVVELVQERARL